VLESLENVGIICGRRDPAFSSLDCVDSFWDHRFHRLRDGFINTSPRSAPVIQKQIWPFYIFQLCDDVRFVQNKD
jgi:hypothetical protein